MNGAARGAGGALPARRRGGAGRWHVRRRGAAPAARDAGRCMGKEPGAARRGAGRFSLRSAASSSWKSWVAHGAVSSCTSSPSLSLRDLGRLPPAHRPVPRARSPPWAVSQGPPPPPPRTWRCTCKGLWCCSPCWASPLWASRCPPAPPWTWTTLRRRGWKPSEGRSWASCGSPAPRRPSGRPMCPTRFWPSIIAPGSSWRRWRRRRRRAALRTTLSPNTMPKRSINLTWSKASPSTVSAGLTPCRRGCRAPGAGCPGLHAWRRGGRPGPRGAGPLREGATAAGGASSPACALGGGGWGGWGAGAGGPRPDAEGGPRRRALGAPTGRRGFWQRVAPPQVEVGAGSGLRGPGAALAQAQARV